MAFMVGSAEAFDFGLYPQTPKHFTNYLQTNISNLANAAVGLSQSFIEMTKNLFQKHNDEAVLSAARNLALSANMLFDMNIIQALVTLQAIQTAKPLMQRFVMANPELYKLHQNQQIESYYGSYTDNDPQSNPEMRLDYRQVMDGVIQESPEGYMTRTYYFDDIDEEDVVLTAKDQFNILDTWDEVTRAIAQGLDPTSITAEKIKGL